MNKSILVVLFVLVMAGGIYMAIQSQRTQNTTSHGEMHDSSSVAQSHRSYELEVTSDTNTIKSRKPVKLSYKIKNDQGKYLNKYEVSHEKIMHFIVVRRDLQHFQHLHPDYNSSNNEFTIVVTFPTDGSYRIFPDFVPGDENPQKLPVTVNADIQVGDIGKYKGTIATADINDQKTVGGYEITFLFPDTQGIKSQKEITYSLLVAKGGQPVNNLENYLGAKGHSVILKENTLDYIHTHALESGSSEGHSAGHSSAMKEAKENQIDFATTLPESGTYKIFTQFQHEGKVITTDYVINVE